MPPQVVLHEQTGQPASCMRGLASYANRVARSPLTDCFGDASEMRDWLWSQPVKLDLGADGNAEPGCLPEQRSRVWPKDGLNCWEATGNWLGWHLRNQSPIEAHLFDSRINGQRHVFPAARFLGEDDPPTPIVLQPPASSGRERLRMQALVLNAAQALGPLPAPLQLVRRKEFWPWDRIGDFVVEMGGMQQAERTAPLPDSVLRALPSFWSKLKFRQWPTAAGDLLFLILEKDWVPSLKDLAVGVATGGFSALGSQEGGHGMAYVVKITAAALSGGSGGRNAGTPDGAPANAWYDSFGSGSSFVGGNLIQDLLQDLLPQQWLPGYVNPYEGQIVNAAGDPKVYMVQQGRKRWITNPSFFDGTHGYSFSQILTIPIGALNALPVGVNIVPALAPSLQTPFAAPASPASFGL